jgi:hypothetical protein
MPSFTADFTSSDFSEAGIPARLPIISLYCPPIGTACRPEETEEKEHVNQFSVRQKGNVVLLFVASAILILSDWSVIPALPENLEARCCFLAFSDALQALC